MMAQYLLILAAVSVVMLLTGFGCFFLCDVWLRHGYGSRVPRARTLAETMAWNLDRQAIKLKGVRRQLFMEWLQCHCRGSETKYMNQTHKGLQVVLKCWLEAVDPGDLHSEYELLVSEIAWWRDADEKTLLRCMSEMFVERYGSR